MIRLGITGGIGSGKSYVAHLLEEKGFPLYDTDREAKRLTLTHPRIREALSTLLGTEVYEQTTACQLFVLFTGACRTNQWNYSSLCV